MDVTDISRPAAAARANARIGNPSEFHAAVARSGNLARLSAHSHKAAVELEALTASIKGSPFTLRHGLIEAKGFTPRLAA